jgi:hypothetical protein
MSYVRVLSAVALASISATPAAAQSVAGPAALQAKVRAALRGAHSFVETVKIKPMLLAPQGGTIVLTVVAPNRFHQLETGLPGDPDDTIIIGHEIYAKKARGWTEETWSDFLISGFEEDVFDVKVLSLGPDAGDAGSFVMKDPYVAKESNTLQCTYDKATFRPRACVGDYATVAYSYDDPATAIEPPKNAVRDDK